MRRENNIQKNLLYAVSILGSGAGFVTQMLVSGFWTTAFSHDVFYFSVNVAFYFLSLGLGSLLSSRLKNVRLETLLWVTALLALWSGVSVSVLRFCIGKFGVAWALPVLIPILTVTVAGVLAGMIIPLTLRLGEKSYGMKLSTLFFFDYTAAIVFTLVFTFFLLIPYGYSKTAIGLGVFCLATLAALSLAARVRTVVYWVGLCVFFILPFLLHSKLVASKAPTMDLSGEAKVLYSEQSHYQKIVLTEETTTDPYLNISKQHVLYLDGFIQFSTIDEQAYHFCLANIPVTASEYSKNLVKNVLVLGGGDGLAVRNLLTFRNIQNITLVELDPAMIRLSKTHPTFLAYNQNALASPRVKVITTDAFRWVAEQKQKYDVILIDFPQPKNLALARLFSAEFYSMVMKLLNPKGMVSVQAGPSFSFEDPTFSTLSKVTTSIRHTFASLGFPAFVYITPRDGEAFVMATPNKEFNMTGFARLVGIYGQQGLGELCTYHPSWKEPPVEVNTLNTLKLAGYMLDWFKSAGGPFFNYRGDHAIFLPN